MFRKVLVANRGEVALRIFRACRELGVGSVAVYSEADAGAAWVRGADEAYPLKGASAAETYLNQTQILAVARGCGVEAIHPGYGFLSENAGFVATCEAAGVVFIGPTAAAMEAMGSKARAREVAVGAGVPVIPGVDGAGKRDAELLAAAVEIGFPVLIKASAGGGGKGMRIVRSAKEFGDLIGAARNEARSAFGDDHLLLEKYFTEIHHVEIQVLGDQYGRVLHLFERECSIQRRHQKIIEETPSPTITPELRGEMALAAVALAEAVGYTSAGTVEFVVDGAGRFYLLEMNTRLQVEHPITEAVTGVDLAVWQIRIAAGEALPFAQEEIRQRGHAIECRVYAEDPDQAFLPSIGEITAYRRPIGPGIRVDDGIEMGAAVTPYYDPMVAKVVAWGADRPEAIGKMARALGEMVVLGVTTNIPYLLAILQHPAFEGGRTTTNFIPDHMEDWRPQAGGGDGDWLAAAAWEVLRGGSKRATAGQSRDGAAASPDPWQEAAGWRNVTTDF